MRNQPAVGAIRQSKPRHPGRLQDILACPHCGAQSFTPGDSSMSCSACGKEYRVVDGVPVLRGGDVTVMPVDHSSNPMSEEVLAWLATLDGYSLNLGAGATDYQIQSCVEVEYSIFRNTDVVADAHHLPFADGVFEAVVTFNTFEHLYDPPRAARELHRVLKPGGRLLLLTASLQPLHEEPHHYYNTTEAGLLRWFSDFEARSCRVPQDLGSALSLAWLSEEIIHYVGLTLGGDPSQEVAATTLEQWRELWVHRANPEGPIWEIMRRLSPEVQKRFSGGFELRATKAR
jgi:SAM-dependent methyltransferase